MSSWSQRVSDFAIHIVYIASLSTLGVHKVVIITGFLEMRLQHSFPARSH